MIFSIFVFICILGVIYPTFVYPVLLSIFARLFNNPVKINTNFQPHVSIVIAAYNEENYISRAINSILALNYPLDKIHLFVGSDGSNDRTVEIANSYADKISNLKVFKLGRMGKNQVLNNIYPALSTDFVFFMDADFRLSPDSLRHSIKYFADTNVTGVISKFNIVVLDEGENSGAQGEGAYQRLERLIKQKESAIWTTVNNFGFYGIRKSALKYIPNANVCDDMYNVLSASAGGGRVIFAPESQVDEVREKSAGEEMLRRVRLSSGGISTSLAVKSLLNPFASWAGFFFVSHKFSRYFFPFYMITVLLLTPIVSFENRILFDFLVIAQAAFYGFAILGSLFNRFEVHFRLFSLPFFFVLINLGFLLGAIRFFRGEQNSVWERIDTRQTNNE